MGLMDGRRRRDCERRHRCLKKPEAGRGRQVSRFGRALVDDQDPSERMRRAIDSPRGRRLYGQRIATVEPVFAHIRYRKQMNRFTLRGQTKVSTQWQLYCLVHNIAKIARRGGQQARSRGRRATPRAVCGRIGRADRSIDASGALG